MSQQEKNPYQIFSKEILSNWKAQGVNYIKIEELTHSNGITLFELIPDSELLDGEHETLYPIDSEDVRDLLILDKKSKFLVHDIYLADEED